MLGKNTMLAAGAVIAGLLMPAQAMAQYEAYTRVDLNLRVGPDTNYGVIDVIPYGEPVNVLGCLDQFAWCDVEWYGLRGWVAATYLVQADNTMVYLPQFAPRIGLPIISFSFSSYHDRHYRDRPWYRERSGRWRGREYRRGDRPRARREVRERIREEQRLDDRQERRTERRQENREEQRQERRQENRQERARTERRQENRQERARTEQRQERARTEQRQENRRERARTEQRQQRQERQQTEQPRQRQQAEQPRQRQRVEEPREGQRTQRPRQRETEQNQQREVQQ